MKGKAPPKKMAPSPAPVPAPPLPVEGTQIGGANEPLLDTVTTQLSVPPPGELCLAKGVGSALSGAVMGSLFGFGSGLIKREGFMVAVREGGSSAKTFAVLSAVHSVVTCYLRKFRRKEDAINAGIAGCASGLALSWGADPATMAQNCFGFGIFAFGFEYISPSGGMGGGGGGTPAPAVAAQLSGIHVNGLSSKASLLAHRFRRRLSRDQRVLALLSDTPLSDSALYTMCRSAKVPCKRVCELKGTQLAACHRSQLQPFVRASSLSR